MRRAVALGAVFVALSGATACQLEGLAFTEDRRVEILAPDYRELVDLPVTVDWQVTNDKLAQRLGSDIQFGVFVDIDPQPPGEPLSYFARNDPTCERPGSCSGIQYLRQRGIHTTSETEMTFRTLPIAAGVDLERGDPDFHEVTLILLDNEGVRIGESAWAIIFEVNRGART